MTRSRRSAVPVVASTLRNTLVQIGTGYSSSQIHQPVTSKQISLPPLASPLPPISTTFRQGRKTAGAQHARSPGSSVTRPGHTAANITALSTTPPNESEPPLPPSLPSNHFMGTAEFCALISKDVARSEGDRGEGNKDFKLVWYKAQCGDNLRDRCFVLWEEKCLGRLDLDLGVGSGVDEVTCLFCREWWVARNGDELRCNGYRTDAV
ncbi:hypothetical protein PAAG_05895 [Paracoccidioides lutzii Pb01]|uniref:Uncharacterized protein n=1 Tax=Paracoccidioides lutzii (strain ATCC MYA-826 / Pb01) TaxID=502779 RepID=C1H554_PARBA|nr:hypothetical protein PAAG_05895 [Paracoccidioides lutzii Pb01]EEH34848.2 hypothetical protein PAAG_05895 [Paracoccidioides lutzii Pb01]